MEVGVQTFLQPFGHLLCILLVNVFHKPLQVGLKNRKHVGFTTVEETKRVQKFSVSAVRYLCVELGQLFVVYVALSVNSPLIAKLEQKHTKGSLDETRVSNGDPR